ncbi:FAD-binding domain-containing protein [Macrolepiota fuliginosa MF-IS2]|uniref:FAD-binding domain-containing protein n=1 Tax=Macrolepiota fuliginosa MF-IS2 TaxID=1400762 RepID=A0A9P5XF06_9AGAR|nr:FAD-binding domain-containing protein [Macrolepiota fuliginosa MF-IS2]
MWLAAFTVLALLSRHSLGKNTYREEGHYEARQLSNPTCREISDTISSSSAVYYPVLNPQKYTKGISHWARSSTQRAACVVEPGTAADVAKILQTLGSRRTPFAVKGGGHASNPEFSSTTGVQIAMYRFSDVVYNSTDQTVTVGSGLIWDDVYAALAPHGVNVVGGRVTGVGVAGFTLGGGYSYLTNQYGLTIDTVVAFELVKPDGTILWVTKDTQPDLFFGLKGGFNNFGIVTRFTLKTFPQTQVWGGLITVTAPFIDQISAATADFSANVKDPKASILTTYNFLLGQPGVSQILFYDAPQPPPGVFDKFMNIPSFTKDVGTRDFLSLVKASPANVTAGTRAIFNTVSVLDYTPGLLKAVQNESIFWGSRLSNLLEGNTGVFISYDVEPFLPDFLSHADSPSAYPPTRNKSYSPFNLYYAWLSKADDDDFHSAARQSASRLHDVAIAEGQVLDNASVYPNYAIFDTPLSELYGDNLPILQALKKVHDPNNVMGLAGGWKF